MYMVLFSKRRCAGNRSSPPQLKLGYTAAYLVACRDEYSREGTGGRGVFCLGAGRTSSVHLPPWLCV